MAPSARCALLGAGDAYEFPPVSLPCSNILVANGDDVKVGTPLVDGAKVTAKVEKQGREKKVVTFKYKPKKHSHSKYGHRQPYTKVTVEKIEA